jgi:hypothetical protein
VKYPLDFFFFYLKLPRFVGKSYFLKDMKRFNILLVIFIALISCKGHSDPAEKEVASDAQERYMSFGDKIKAEQAMSTSEMATEYANLKANDSLPTKFTARVKEVCKAKGCWMKLELPNGQEAMVRFKDYGFFVPTDIEGKEVVVNGLAFVSQMSVEEQRHYAKDAGTSEEKIAQIIEPKRTLGFEADGVLVRE